MYSNWAAGGQDIGRFNSGSNLLSKLTIHDRQTCIILTRLSKFEHTCSRRIPTHKLLILSSLIDSKEDRLKKAAHGHKEADVLPLNYSRPFEPATAVTDLCLAAIPAANPRKLVCFRQRCVIEKSGLFFHGRSGKYPTHGSTADVEATGDLGFAEARASKLADLIGMHGCGCGPAEALAVQSSMS